MSIMSIGDNYNFGEALNTLMKDENDKHGIALPWWDDNDIVKIQRPDENSKMTSPYLYLETPAGRFPWTPNQEELFYEEWSIVVKF